MGSLRAAPGLRARSRARGAVHGARRHGLGGPGRAPLALHGAAHRGRRHAGRRALHPMADARQAAPRLQARGGRREEVGGGARGDGPHRSGPLVQDPLDRYCPHLPPDDRPLFLLHEGAAGGLPRRGGHDHHRVLLRRGVRQPRGHDRHLQQPRLRTHAGHHDRRRAHDGGHRRQGGRGRRRRARRWPRWCASPPRSPARCCRT